MNAYLVIAQKVLAGVGKPLNASEILRHAYLNGWMPDHLHGGTQHKTLQARISEDIRKYGDRSLFYRTDRGVFFLQSLRLEKSLSPKERMGIIARPRYRELLNKQPILKVNQKSISSSLETEFIGEECLDRLLSPENTHYSLLVDKREQEASFWVFVVVCKNDSVLTYRHGRYREKADEFLNQRCIGFKTVLTSSNSTFLDRDDHGIRAAGISSAYADLGVPLYNFNLETEKENAKVEFLTLFNSENDRNDLVCVVTYRCPEWLEPLKRRLAINDLCWINYRSTPNNMNDFDSWSQRILPELFKRYKSEKKLVCSP